MPHRVPVAKPLRDAHHSATPQPTYDLDRPSAAKRGYDRRWQRFRLLVLARDPMCRRCGAHVSELVHHVIPKDKGGPDSRENCVGLDTFCHNIVTQLEKQGRRWMPDGRTE